MDNMKMTELQIIVPKMPEITSNFDQIKAEVEKMVVRYDGLVYDDIGQAKRDKAALNKLKTALNKARIETGKQYNAPFEVFKTQVDELIDNINSAANGISKQIAAADEARKAEKREAITKIFGEMDFPPEVTLERLWNEKWLNASYSEKAVRDDLQTREIAIRNALSSISSLESYIPETRQKYLESLDMGAAINYRAQLVEMERRVKEQQAREAREKAEQEARAQAEREAAEETAVLKAAPEPELPDLPELPDTLPPEALPEPEGDYTRQWYDIQLLVSEVELAAVENFITSLGAEYRFSAEQESENG